MAASTSTGPVTELVTIALNGESYEGQETILSEHPPKNPPSASYWGLQHEDQAKLHWVISTPKTPLTPSSSYARLTISAPQLASTF